MNQGKAKKIILIIIIFLLILLGGIAYAYFATDIFKTPKQLFAKYLVNNATQLAEFNLEPYNESFEKMKENKTEIDLSISNNVIPQEISLTYLGDLQNEKESLDFEIKQEDEQVMQTKLAVNNDTYGIYFEGLHEKYLALENRNLKKFFSNFIEDEEIANMIPDQIALLNPLSEEEKTKLNNLYATYIQKFLNQFEESVFTSENGIQVDIDGETVKANKYSATTSTKKILESIINIMTELLNDQDFIDLYNSRMSWGTNNIEDMKSQIDELKTSLDSSYMADSQIVISVYSADKRTVKTEINIDNNAEISEFMIKDNNNIVFKSNISKSGENNVASEEKIIITNNFNDNQGELTFERSKNYNQDDVKALEDLSDSGDYYYYLGGYENQNTKIRLQSTKNNDNVTTKIDLGNENYSAVVKFKFDSNLNVEELTDENTLILNDYSKDDLNSLGEEIIQNLSKTVEEHPNYYISGLFMLLGFSDEDLSNYENLTGDETNNFIEENTIETNTDPIENEEDINDLGRRVDEAISGAIDKSLSDYHDQKQEDPDTLPDNFLTVDAIKSNCSENMEIELIDGTTLKSVLEDKIFYTQINIDGNTWELVETQTLYSENGDLETAEPIE